MRKLLILLSIVVILPLFSLNISAEDKVDDYISDFENILPEGFEGMSDTDKLMERAELSTLFSEIVSALSDGKGDIAAFFFTLLGSVTLMSVGALCHDRLSGAVQTSVGIVCSVLIFLSISPLINMISDAIEKISSFFASLIPIAVGITALGGGVTTASVQGSGMYAALSAVGGLGGQIFLSLSAFGLAMSLLSAFSGEGISSVLRGFRGLFGWVTGIFTALITAAFSLQTLVASSADSAAMRAVKYAASGLIPVVGSTVSGAISTLATGLTYAKGVVGGGAILVILYMALSPMVLLLAYRLSLSLCIILSDFTGSPVASRVLSAYRFALDMTITVYALSALIYLFEIVLITMMGVSLS